MNRFLRMLGLMTVKQHNHEMEEFRHRCEEFAKDYLDYSDGLTIGSLPADIRGGEIGPAVVIGSYCRLDNVTLNGIKFAPWVRNSFVKSAISKESKVMESPRAAVRARKAAMGVRDDS